AQKFYQEQLWSAEKSHLIGLSYFKERKFRDETIKKFGLGYATGNNSLSKTALENGYKRDYLVEAGLAVVREDGTLADRFYNRVMFPIHSISGRVVAFGGRILVNDKNKQKYVNTRETEIYVKNRIVYGLFFAKQEITKQKKCYLVEGYTDVISMHQAGIENVVASCGTSLTSGQINMIKRFTDNLTIIYDGDEAGQNASVKGIDLILKEGMKVKIVALPPDEDPDSFAKSHTKQEIEDYITDHEEDFITYKSKKLKDVAGKDIAKRAQVINEILNTIALVQDRIERNLYADMIVEMFHLQSETVFQKIAQIRKQNRQLDEARERYNANQQTTQDDVIPDNANIEGKIEIASSILDLPEKELLYYVLKYGRYPMFTDDDYRNGRKADQVIKVSEYISNGLSEDEIVFENQLYRKIYDEY
ncbi:MAG: DNA primase, partial [Bacteroidales bacterium]|nr:DNA primase [Bacteroidales bacterium]